MYRIMLLLFGILGVSLSLALGLFSVITWQIAGVLIAVSIGIPSLILSYEKVRITSEGSAKPNKERKEQEITTEEKEILRDETIHVGPHDAYSYVLQFKRGDTLNGEISSTSHIDIYFVNDANFMKWEKARPSHVNTQANLF